MEKKKRQNGRQFLTFTLGKEVFALGIISVREVLELTPINAIPNTPRFMRGVINLRGHAVPVVDMRMKMDMKPSGQTINTCIIVTEMERDGKKHVIGSLVDSVREVIELSPNAIEQAPKIGSSVNSGHIKGMGRKGDGFIIILEVESIFSETELEAAKQILEDEPGKIGSQAA